MARRLRLIAGSLPVQFDQLLSKKLPASNAPLVVCESNIGLKGIALVDDLRDSCNASVARTIVTVNRNMHKPQG